ncbi:MAG: HAD-IA family hydrolase [Chthoniobacterales bacterium]
MSPIKSIFFDAAGTLFRLTCTVGHHYALVGRGIGVQLEVDALNRAFAVSWKRTAPPAGTGDPRADDDKGWWRALVFDVLEQVAPEMHELDRDNFFEVAYEHFAEAGVWQLFPETATVLEELATRYELAVVSSFDGRLRVILEQFAVSKFFRFVFISSELGFDKPDPRIFQRALELSGRTGGEVLHVGDDPERDWNAARAAGLHVFELRRPQNTLRELLAFL